MSDNYERCAIEVSRALGRELTESERKEVGDKVASIIQKFDRDGQAGELNTRVIKAIEELGSNIEAAALIEKRNAALNAKAVINQTNYLAGVWSENPAEGLRAVFGNSLADKQGSKNGVLSHTNALAQSYVSGLTSRLAEKDLTKVAANGSLTKDIFFAKYELSKKNPDKTILNKFAPEAVEIAKIVEEYQELARGNYNKAGGWVGKAEGYVVRRTHDPSKIQKAAGPEYKVGAPEHLEAWKNFMLENLDFDKSLPEVPTDKRGSVLESQFQQHANGYHLKFSEGGESSVSGFGSIGQRQSHQREYHFKTPEAEFEYYQKYTQGGNVVEDAINSLMRMARDTAIMDKLGPNAENNLSEIFNRTKEKLHADKKGHLIPKFEKEFEYLMDTYWPYINGTTSIPANETFAAWSQTLRNIQVMRDLGRVVFSAFTDPAYYGATMRHYGERNLTNMFKMMGEAFSATFGGVGKEISPEMMALASEMGIVLKPINTPISAAFGEMDMPGRISNWTQTFFKYNMMSWWQDRIKLGASMGMSHRHALHAEMTFHNLPEGMQAALRQFDISPEGWDVIRKSSLHIDEEGNKFLTPESLKKMELSHFDSLPEVQTRKSLTKSEKAINHSRESARTKLMNNYRALFSEIASMATSEPGGMERAMMLHGTRPGTAKGELIRHLGGLKGFMVGAMRRHLGREIHGYSAERLSLVDALKAMVTGENKSAFSGLVNLAVFSTMMGFASYSAKQIAKGLLPRLPTDAESARDIIMTSAYQGGGFGIMGDFLFGEMKNRYGQTALETIAGPTARTFTDITDLFGRIRAAAGGSDKEDVAAKTFQFLLHYTPGFNAAYSIFYTKWALDYGFVYRLQEMLNPGYLKRMERRLEKDNDQRFILPPSEWVK